MSGKTFEVNFDGLVGPTHNYSGLSYGNVASMLNQEALSNPREAALQGLEKMKLLTSLGLVQGVLPPHERPHLPTLKALGFDGSDAAILAKAYAHDPALLYAVSSAASMWTANAATVSSSYDSRDGRVHVVPANLVSKFHRSIEAEFTAKILKLIFHDEQYFRHHAPLPACTEFADEGAANHARFCSDYSAAGIHLFVYGRQAWKSRATPKLFPARQTFEAVQALARLHALPEESVVFAQQNPEAIDAGVFHNDVASVGNKRVFLYHELAFVETSQVLQTLQQKFPELTAIRIPNEKIPLKTAVDTYLFNSQLVSVDEHKMVLIAPIECSQNPVVQSLLDDILQGDNPIERIIYMNLRESMRNGGGPACLRLRVVLSAEELQATHSGVFLTDELYAKLKAWVVRHYRDRLLPKDLADPHLLIEVKTALDELTSLLKFTSVYSFQ